MGGGGTTISPEFTGGATGDMFNEWGDSTGSQMVMVNGGKIAGAVMTGAVGLIAVAGITVWLIHRA